MKICLYTAIPARAQFQPFVRPPIQRAKSTVRHVLDRLRTSLSGRLHVNDFHYQVAKSLADNSNRGDIAIRLAVREQIVSVAGHHPVEFVEVEWGRLTPEIVCDINDSCDLFVIAGGGYLFIFGDGSGGRSFDDIPYLQKIRCPVVAYGIGMNRLMHEAVRDLRDLPVETQNKILDFVKACDQIGVRDAHTLELLNLYGDRPVSLIGDPVLFLRGLQPIATGQRPVHGYSIGINLAAHGWRALTPLKSLLPNFVQLLKHVQNSHGAKFTYLLHHEFEEVVVSFLRQQGISLNVVRAGALELLESYAHLDFVICQMLHACIFSTNQNVPFLNIAYDQKSVAFCDLLGVPQCVLPHTAATATALKERFDAVFATRDAVKKTLMARKLPLEEAQMKFMQEVVAPIRGAVTVA